jgi:hypothetical protein
MRTRLIVFAACLILLTGCVAGPTSRFATGDPAGFAAGLWHGLLTPITLIISFLNENVRMYEANNVGPEYDLGFLMGFFILLSVPTAIRLSRKSKLFRKW